MAIPVAIANRLGFLILGLTNNFAYVIMLSAAYDLLKQIDNQNNAAAQANNSNATGPAPAPEPEKYCNEHSTSTILLADTIPSLVTKLVYPFLFVGLPAAWRAIATAVLCTASFVITGLGTSDILIFTGVSFASFSSGLGESTYLSRTPLYGDVSLSGWAMGTGAAGLLGSIVYAVLRMVLPIKFIMLIMLIVPAAMMLAYFKMITPIGDDSGIGPSTAATIGPANTAEPVVLSLECKTFDEATHQRQPIETNLGRVRSYGAKSESDMSNLDKQFSTSKDGGQLIDDDLAKFGLKEKIQFLPQLSKYFMPLLLVYFAEYFINQGLFELIYYPEISFLNHAAQYRWFQVSYQLGVMISRSSLDFFVIKQIWTMSLLQAINAVLFLAHTSKWIHLPSFYLVIVIIIYEGLLGGFTYANAFFRMKKELEPSKQEFGISTVTIADTLGIVLAGMAAMPVHNALCGLYTTPTGQ